jgi:hypothetical protein
MLNKDIALTGLAEKYISIRITIKELASAIQESGTSGILVKQFLPLLVAWILMKFSGNLIGLAVEEAGKKRVAQEPGIEDLSLMNILRNQESMNGPIGEFKSSSRKQSHHSGKRKWTSSTCMMKIPLLEKCARSLVMKVWVA